MVSSNVKYPIVFTKYLPVHCKCNSVSFGMRRTSSLKSKYWLRDHFSFAELGAAGFPLPVINSVHFTNTQLTVAKVHFILNPTVRQSFCLCVEGRELSWKKSCFKIKEYVSCLEYLIPLEKRNVSFFNRCLLNYF